MSVALDYIYYTYDDYKNWKGDWELYEGTAVAMSPAPMIRHQAIASNIIFDLKSSLGCKECMVIGEADYKISDDTVFRPDIALICNETNKKYISKAPKIVVEIVSKSTVYNDEKYKYSIYEKEKVKYYILVYPNDLVAKVYKLDGKSYQKEGDFSNETYYFDEIECQVSIDFDRVFRDFRE